MTAITKADIPSDIDTVEKLAAWCGFILSSLNPSTTAVEGVGISERVAQSNIFYIGADNKDRLLIRLSLQYDPEYRAGGLKPWQYAMEISSTALPTNFKS